MSRSPIRHRNAITYCVDQNVLPYALYSAEQAILCTPNRDFDVLICSLDRLDIPQHFADLGIRSVHIDLQSEIAAENLPLGWLPITTYLRLWLPRYFHGTYDRILYLDADTMIQTDRLCALFKCDLNDCVIASARDVQQWKNLNKPIHDYEKRQIRHQKYLNSGVQLIDCARYVDDRCLERMLEANQRGEHLLQHDQSLVNLVLMDEIAELHPTWNWQWSSNYPLFSVFAQPQILHFCGFSKPWDTNTVYPRALSVSLYLFLARHFPDQAIPPLEPNAYDTTWRARITALIHHALGLRALHKLTKRFETDLTTLK